jgi:hypothetical protein
MEDIMFHDWHNVIINAKLILAVGYVLYQGFKWIKADHTKTPLRAHNGDRLSVS